MKNLFLLLADSILPNIAIVTKVVNYYFCTLKWFNFANSFKACFDVNTLNLKQTNFRPFSNVFCFSPLTNMRVNEIFAEVNKKRCLIHPSTVGKKKKKIHQAPESSTGPK